jgi:putative FmdB family regulatory protein
MPTYEFVCPDGHTFDKFFRTMSSAPGELACPVCGKTATRKISGGAGLVFKGSGFYITDYGKDGKKKQGAPASSNSESSGSSGESSGGDSKSGSKSESKSADSAGSSSSSSSSSGSSSDSGSSSSSGGKSSDSSSGKSTPKPKGPDSQ